MAELSRSNPVDRAPHPLVFVQPFTQTSQPPVKTQDPNRPIANAFLAGNPQKLPLHLLYAQQNASGQSLLCRAPVKKDPRIPSQRETLEPILVGGLLVLNVTVPPLGIAADATLAGACQPSAPSPEPLPCPFNDNNASRLDPTSPNALPTKERIGLVWQGQSSQPNPDNCAVIFQTTNVRDCKPPLTDPLEVAKIKFPNIEKFLPVGSELIGFAVARISNEFDYFSKLRSETNDIILITQTKGTPNNTIRIVAVYNDNSLLVGNELSKDGVLVRTLNIGFKVDASLPIAILGVHFSKGPEFNFPADPIYLILGSTDPKNTERYFVEIGYSPITNKIDVASSGKLSTVALTVCKSEQGDPNYLKALQQFIGSIEKTQF